MTMTYVHRIVYTMDSPKRTRSQSLIIRMNDDERAELDALAEDERSNASMVVRRLLRAAYVKRFGDKKPRRKGA